MDQPKCEICKQFTCCSVISGLIHRVNFLLDEKEKEKFIQKIMDQMAPVCKGYQQKV